MNMKIFLLFCFVSLGAGQWVKEMENPGLYEGDMVLTPQQYADAKAGKLSYGTRKDRRWPTTIYYDWSSERANNPGILSAIADYERYTCLRFKRRTNQRAYMYFFKGGGCYAFIGYNGGQSRISIGNRCDGKGTVLHEIAHALGIYHEQARPDRDNYITVMFENIRNGMESQFKKQSTNIIDSLGTDYDYKSVMHYPDWAFSKNGRPTIKTRDPSMQKVIGRRGGFSDIDIVQINRMYCGGVVPKTHIPPQPPTRGPPKPPTGFPPQPPTRGPPKPPTRGPTKSFTIQNAQGLCISVSRYNHLVLTKSCSTKFNYANHNLYIAGTKKCLQTTADFDYAYINVVMRCPSSPTFSVYKDNQGTALIKNIKTGKCFQPFLTKLAGLSIIMHSSCTHLFKMV